MTALPTGSILVSLQPASPGSTLAAAGDLNYAQQVVVLTVASPTATLPETRASLYRINSTAELGSGVITIPASFEPAYAEHDGRHSGLYYVFYHGGDKDNSAHSPITIRSETQNTTICTLAVGEALVMNFDSRIAASISPTETIPVSSGYLIYNPFGGSGSGLPEGGEAGQVLAKTELSYEWVDASSLPSRLPTELPSRGYRWSKARLSGGTYYGAPTGSGNKIFNADFLDRTYTLGVATATEIVNADSVAWFDASASHGVLTALRPGRFQINYSVGASSSADRGTAAVLGTELTGDFLIRHFRGTTEMARGGYESIFIDEASDRLNYCSSSAIFNDVQAGDTFQVIFSRDRDEFGISYFAIDALALIALPGADGARGEAGTGSESVPATGNPRAQRRAYAQRAEPYTALEYTTEDYDSTTIIHIPFAESHAHEADELRTDVTEININREGEIGARLIINQDTKITQQSSVGDPEIELQVLVVEVQTSTIPTWFFAADGITDFYILGSAVPAQVEAGLDLAEQARHLAVNGLNLVYQFNNDDIRIDGPNDNGNIRANKFIDNRHFVFIPTDAEFDLLQNVWLQGKMDSIKLGGNAPGSIDEDLSSPERFAEYSIDLMEFATEGTNRDTLQGNRIEVRVRTDIAEEWSTRRDTRFFVLAFKTLNVEGYVSEFGIYFYGKVSTDQVNATDRIANVATRGVRFSSNVDERAALRASGYVPGDTVIMAGYDVDGAHVTGAYLKSTDFQALTYDDENGAALLVSNSDIPLIFTQAGTLVDRISIRLFPGSAALATAELFGLINNGSDTDFTLKLSDEVPTAGSNTVQLDGPILRWSANSNQKRAFGRLNFKPGDPVKIRAYDLHGNWLGNRATKFWYLHDAWRAENGYVQISQDTTDDPFGAVHFIDAFYLRIEILPSTQPALVADRYSEIEGLLFYGKNIVEVPSASTPGVKTGNREISFSAQTYDVARIALNKMVIGDLVELTSFGEDGVRLKREVHTLAGVPDTTSAPDRVSLPLRDRLNSSIVNSASISIILSTSFGKYREDTKETLELSTAFIKSDPLHIVRKRITGSASATNPGIAIGFSGVEWYATAHERVVIGELGIQPGEKVDLIARQDDGTITHEQTHIINSAGLDDGDPDHLAFVFTEQLSGIDGYADNISLYLRQAKPLGLSAEQAAELTHATTFTNSDPLHVVALRSPSLPSATNPFIYIIQNQVYFYVDDEARAFILASDVQTGDSVLLIGKDANGVEVASEHKVIDAGGLIHTHADYLQFVATESVSAAMRGAHELSVLIRPGARDPHLRLQVEQWGEWTLLQGWGTGIGQTPYAVDGVDTRITFNPDDWFEFRWDYFGTRRSTSFAFGWILGNVIDIAASITNESLEIRPGTGRLVRFSYSAVNGRQFIIYGRKRITQIIPTA